MRRRRRGDGGDVDRDHLGHDARHEQHADHGHMHDAAGRVVAHVDPEGHRTVYLHDGAGRLTDILSPDAGHVRQRFDLTGRLIERIDATGARVTWTYDPIGRLTDERAFDPSGAEVSAVRRFYDTGGPFARGQLVAAEDTTSDLWGGTVNTAARMESHGEPGRIQISAATAQRLPPASSSSRAGRSRSRARARWRPCGCEIARSRAPPHGEDVARRSPPRWSGRFRRCERPSRAQHTSVIFIRSLADPNGVLALPSKESRRRPPRRLESWECAMFSIDPGRSARPHTIFTAAAGVTALLAFAGTARADSYIRVPNAAISGYNDKQLSGVSVAQCEAACTNEKSFVCKSFDYYKTTSKCDLSSKSASDVGGLKFTYKDNPYDHYARTTGYARFPNAAISGYNDKQLSGVSVAQCQAACTNEKSFVCKSFDYYKTTSKCDLSSKSASDVGGLKYDYKDNPYDHYARGAEPPPPAPPAPPPPPPPPKCPDGAVVLDGKDCARLTAWPNLTPLPAGTKVAIRLRQVYLGHSGWHAPWNRWLGLGADGKTIDATRVDLDSRDLFVVTTAMLDPQSWDMPWYNLRASNGRYVGTVINPSMKLVADFDEPDAVLFARSRTSNSQFLWLRTTWSNLAARFDLAKRGKHEQWCLSAYSTQNPPQGLTGGFTEGCKPASEVDFFVVEPVAKL